MTTRDVAFTFEVLRQHGLPSYRALLHGVEIAVVDARTIEFRAPQPDGWAFLDLVATFPIQSVAFWKTRDVSAMSLDMPLGSGPYLVDEMDLSKRIVLPRDPDYWGSDLSVNRGKWNFDKIETLQFKDRTAMIEALMAGVLDIIREYDASSSTRIYAGAKLARGELLRSEFREGSGGRFAALVFNLRRPPLNDRRVRAAIACALDTERMRRVLFGDAYAAPDSVYGTLKFGAHGPGSGREGDKRTLSR